MSQYFLSLLLRFSSYFRKTEATRLFLIFHQYLMGNIFEMGRSGRKPHRSFYVEISTTYNLFPCIFFVSFTDYDLSNKNYFHTLKTIYKLQSRNQFRTNKLPGAKIEQQTSLKTISQQRALNPNRINHNRNEFNSESHTAMCSTINSDGTTNSYS